MQSSAAPMRASTNQRAAWLGIVFIALAIIAIIAISRPRHRVAPVKVAAAIESSATPRFENDVIAFHGGGPLLGEAAPIAAPPMKVRWKLRTSDPVPAPSTPATKPTTAPVLTGGPGHFEAAAAIVGGVVYVGDTAGFLRAIDVATGKVKWAYLAEDGFETTPLVVDGRVMLGDLGGVFHAVAADTGRKIWIFETNSQIHASANYMGDDRKRVVFGTDGADVFCLDSATGAKVWEKKSGDRVNGTPSVSKGSALISGCDAQLRAMKGTDGSEEFVVELGALCPGSTAAAGDHLISGTEGGRVLCISAETHKQLWLFEKIEDHAMVYSSPAVSENIVVFGARDRNVYGLDLATGKKLWNTTTRGEVDSSPVISGGRAYVGSKDKKLYVLDLKTGKELWTFTAGRGITATPAIGNGVLIIGDTGGNLFCLE